MGSDDKGKSVQETIAEEARGLAKNVYADVGKPVLAPIGKTAGSAVELLLAPVNFALDGLKAGFERLKARVGKKLERVPPERQIAAPATMASAALHYALLGDGDEVSELREMFENLLMSSLDSATASTAHPAFIAVISQMTPEDAWIAKSINQPDYAACNVFEHDKQGKRALAVYTLLGIDVVKDGRLRSCCISNLDRLGIVRIVGETASNHSEYDEIKKLVEADFPQDTWSHGQSIQVTPFGQQFLDTCVRVRR